jgi:2-keto-4-pentenoate hydratase/2-oxohepta-3-ene-1,7-dioic acid hydratase in catechol pathway
MRFGRLVTGEWVVVQNGSVYDVTDRIEPDPPGVLGELVFGRLDELRGELEHAMSRPSVCREEDAAFGSPVRCPTKVIGAPVNYLEHIAEAEADRSINLGRAIARIEEAGLFLKASSALVGPGDGIQLRFPDRRTDHEVEVGVVIKDTVERVEPAEALAHVAGYAIALDVTLRGREDRSFRKSVQTYGVLGPYLLTPDEIGNPMDLAFELRVNDEVRQRSSTRYLIKDIPSLIAWASEWYTLYPGDVIMTGTPAGVGPLEDGDMLQAELGGVVTMRVPVSRAPAAERMAG